MFLLRGFWSFFDHSLLCTGGFIPRLSLLITIDSMQDAPISENPFICWKVRLLLGLMAYWMRLGVDSHF
jgi:hypothetical protein